MDSLQFLKGLGTLASMVVAVIAAVVVVWFLGSALLESVRHSTLSRASAISASGDSSGVKPPPPTDASPEE